MLSVKILLFKHALQKKKLSLYFHTKIILSFASPEKFFFYFSFSNVQKTLDMLLKDLDIFIHLFICRKDIKFLFS